MWVNGKKTLCWPQELFIVKLNDDGFSFQDEEYGDDNLEDYNIDNNHEDDNINLEGYLEHDDYFDCTNYVDYDNSDDDFIVVDDVEPEDRTFITSYESSRLVKLLNFIQYFLNI